MWLLAAASFLLALITWLAVRIWNFQRRLGDFPGPGLLRTLQIGQDPYNIMKSLRTFRHEYGPNFRLIFGPFTATVILTDPSDIEIILKNNFWLTKSKSYRFLEPWMGRGLLTSAGEKWRRSRKIITPTFHFKILEQFIPVFSTEGATLIKKLKKEVDGPAFDIFPYINLFALDVICETAMGTTVKAQDDADGAYVLAVKDLCSMVQTRTFSFMLRFDFFYKLHPSYQTTKRALKVVHGFIDRVIVNRKKHIVETLAETVKPTTLEDEDMGTKKRMAFLDLLLQSTDDLGQPLSDTTIKDEVHTFMFAGHDTTTASMSFGLYLLSIHPEVQEKVFQEQRDIMGDDPSRNPTYNDLQSMDYLAMVLKENLRMYAAVPTYSRLMMEDGNFNGKIVPAGANVTVNAYLCHQNPAYWPEPEKFDPERFTKDEEAQRHPFAYVPFSAGPRNCMGKKFALLEMKSTISKIIRNYELLPSGDNEKFVLETVVVLKSQNGMRVKLKERKYK